ncbi:MAG TPA: phenylacetic acid degradation bifunctional protein PaaZ [Mycobacteriales bacterium]|nr:phenylacetic acid degradation bifunctional protein PaaZ [Mycobacteriales bacterium]
MVDLLRSYLRDDWYTAPDAGTTLLDAATGDPVARISGTGLDPAAALAHARSVGGPALRRLSFHERAGILKALAGYLNERREASYYPLSSATGATAGDSVFDVDGGIGVLFAYASRGRRELPNASIYLDGAAEPIGRGGGFAGQHVYTPRRGAAVCINAFNFPVWGMLEKFAPAFLAGVPVIVKPASQTAYLAERVFADMIASGLLPAGSAQLICGGVGSLFAHLDGQDTVAFTGSAATAATLRRHPTVLAHSVRFTTEADSLNCSILGPDATPGTAEFDLYLGEVVREMTVKAGQKCTAIRRAIVPAERIGDVVEALAERLARVRVGDPRDPETTMGPLASRAQLEEVRRALGELSSAASVVVGGADASSPGGDPDVGAFLAPTLLRATDPGAGAVHGVEVFGPVATVLGYDGVDDAAALAAAGAGSLVGSIVTHDPAFARAIVLATAAFHGRMLVLDRDSAAESTGHGSPLPMLVHGGPGRAGGGEELGGIRGVLHYMARSALQGSPAMLAAITDRWLPGAPRLRDATHPFRKNLEQLRIGETLVTAARTITLEDIERFADLSGDHFYAHMDEAAASANPLFGGRVAHGYLVVSAAAGLFVDPDPGPVLANYGLENLRFLTPVYPGDTLTVTLTCKDKRPRQNENYGEVRWDVVVANQEGKPVASYDVLTLVAKG